MAPRLKKPPQPIKRGKKGSIKRAVYKAGGGKKSLKVAKSMTASNRAALKRMSASQRKSAIDTVLAGRKSVGRTVKGKTKKKDRASQKTSRATTKLNAGLTRFHGSAAAQPKAKPLTATQKAAATAKGNAGRKATKKVTADIARINNKTRPSTRLKTLQGIKSTSPAGKKRATQQSFIQAAGIARTRKMQKR
jgi:hypothetical protein